MHNVTKSCLEVLKQGENCLNSIDDETYCKVVQPFFISSSGEHMRHILDHFLALKNSQRPGVIDYDKRERGSDIEKDRLLTLTRIHEIKKWLITLDEKLLSKSLTIKTEVALAETLVVEVKSSLARELVFAASHAVHHYSTIAIILNLQEIPLDRKFGLAPATASYLRNLDTPCVHSPG